MDEFGSNYTSNADVFPNYNLKGQYDQTDNMNVLNDGQYTSVELFDYFIPMSAVADVKCADMFLPGAKVDKNRDKKCPGGAEKWANWGPGATLAWSRIGPWLPWMGMSEDPANSRHVPGVVVYHARSETLTNFEDLPAEFRKKMEKWFADGALGLNTIGFEAWQRPSTFAEYQVLQPRNNGKNDTT